MEVDLHAGVGALALVAEHDAVAETRMTHHGAESDGHVLDARHLLRPCRGERRADIQPGADGLDMFGGDLAEETRGQGGRLLAVQAALFGMGEIESFAGARHAHVAEPAFLFQSLRILGGTLVGKQALFQPDQEHHRKLQALGGVQRHQLHAVFPVLGLALARLQRRMHQKAGEVVHAFGFLGEEGILAGGELAGGVDQFLEVLDAGLAPFALLAREVLDQAAVADDPLDLFVQRQAVGLFGQGLDQAGEAAQRPGGAGREPAAQQQLGHGRPQRGAGRARLLANGRQRALADAAGGLVDDALEGGIVVAVGDQAQVGERVPDLGALEEAQAAVHPVGNAVPHELFLEQPRLGIGAVEDGDVVSRPAALDLLHQGLDHEPRLVVFVEGGVALQRLALAGLGPELLAETPGIARDQCIGGAQDVPGGTVVLLQPHQTHVRKVLAE